MDLFDFLYPQQAQAAHLRRIASATARLASGAAAAAGAGQDEIEQLTRENRELRVYLSAILQILIEKNLIRAEEVQAKVQALLPPILQGPADEPASDNPFADLRG